VFDLGGGGGGGRAREALGGGTNRSQIVERKSVLSELHIYRVRWKQSSCDWFLQVCLVSGFEVIL